MTNPRGAAEVANLMRGAGDATRVLILLALEPGPLRVKEIVERIGIVQTSVSHHLSILRSMGLVRSERLGHGVRYELGTDGIVLAEALHQMSRGRR